MKLSDRIRLKEAIWNFWEDTCGFILRDDDDERLENSLVNNIDDRISILFSDVFLDEITNLTTKQFNEKYGTDLTDENLSLEVFVLPEELVVRKEVWKDGISTHYYEIEFDDADELIEYIDNVSEFEMMNGWSEELAEEVIGDLKRRE